MAVCFNYLENWEFYIKMSLDINVENRDKLRAGLLMRHLAPLSVIEPIIRAIFLFQQERIAALPVVDEGRLVGWLTEQRLLRVIAQDNVDIYEITAAVIAVAPPATLNINMTLLEMLDVFQHTNESSLPAIDEAQRYVGVITLCELLAAIHGKVPAPRIGGMATPLGVYLTTGRVQGGAGALGLLFTGIELALMLWIIQMLMVFITMVAYSHNGSNFWLYALRIMGINSNFFTSTLPAISAMYELLLYLLVSTVLASFYLLGIRFLPHLAGYHAAEHQTVNALEQGLPLRHELVARMSRVHPRCGTNIGALLALIYLAGALLLILMSTKFAYRNLPLLLLIIVWTSLLIAINWKRIGGWVQLYLTTRPASSKELASGIHAGNEVISRHLQSGSLLTPSHWQRIWNMGIIQVMFGATITVYVMRFFESALINWFYAIQVYLK